MAHTCSECTYLDLNKEYNHGDGKFWCEKKYEWHFANEAECWRYCQAYSRDSRVSDSYKDYSANKQSSSTGCYITTIVCNILGLDDNNYYLNTLRKFRKNKLQKDQKYKQLLVEYDVVGPMIASELISNMDSYMIAKNFFNMGIVKVVELIEKNEDDKAVDLYTLMTQTLKEGFGIKFNPTNQMVEEADINKSGHGYYVKKIAEL